MELDSGGLVIEKELLDVLGSGDGDRGGKQVFTFADIGGKDGFADEAEVDSRVVADDLRVEGRIAVDESDLETEV